MTYARLAFLGSLLLLIGAYFFQYGLDMRPCQLCYYQRVPHFVAVILGGFAIWRGWRGVFLFLALVIWLGAALAVYHVGVEQKWWEGLASCSGATNLSVEDLLATPPARCDEIPWSLFGVSMAGWNALISVVLGVFWFLAWKR